jgi:hypothetical protein
MATLQARLDIETLASAIAQSPIVMTPAAARRRLPDDLQDMGFREMGFEDIDVAILEWIAAEGRRVGRSLIRI